MSFYHQPYSNAGDQGLPTILKQSSEDGDRESASHQDQHVGAISHSLPHSSPVRHPSHWASLSPNSFTFKSFTRPANSSPLPNAGARDLPDQAFVSYANLNPAFGNIQNVNSAGSSSRLRTPLAHSHSSPYLNTPRSGHSRMGSDNIPPFWDPVSLEAESADESPPSSKMSEPSSLRDESRKRNRESVDSHNSRSMKSIRTTPSPGITRPVTPSNSDPMISDDDLMNALGIDSKDTMRAMQEEQKALEAELAAKKQRQQEANNFGGDEWMNEEYARSLHHELNPDRSVGGVASPQSSAQASPHQPLSSLGRPAHASKLGFGRPMPPPAPHSTTKLPLSPAANRSYGLGMSPNGSKQPSTTPRMKTEHASNPNPASKLFVPKDDNFIVISDSESDRNSPNPRGRAVKANGFGLDTRPTTAASSSSSNVSIMDLTNDHPDRFMARRPMNGSNSARGVSPALSHGAKHARMDARLARYTKAANKTPIRGNTPTSFRPTARGTTPTNSRPSMSPFVSVGHHGTGGSSVYGAPQTTMQTGPTTMGSIGQGYNGYGNPFGSTANASDFVDFTSDPSMQGPYTQSAGGGDFSSSSAYPGSAVPGSFGYYDLTGNDDVELPSGNYWGDGEAGDHHDLTQPRLSKEETDKQLRSLVDNITADENLDNLDHNGSPGEMAKDAVLYKHQIIGLNWMKKMEEGSNKGGILADDMGLGKTIQAIALMVSNRSQDPRRKTTLIVAPVALLNQWKTEIADKLRADTPLSVYVYHGSKIANCKWKRLKDFDVVITTYGTLAKEMRKKDAIDLQKRANPDWQATSRSEQLNLLGDDCKWYRVILDEAQNIKNRNTQSAKAVCSLQATYRLCMTGTPMMNHIVELYSLIKFLKIRPYCHWDRFRQDFERPISKNIADDETMRKLQALLKAILLRRTKKSQLDGKPIIQLPPRTTHVAHPVFDAEQEAFYKAIESKTQLTMNRYLKAGTVGKSYSNILVMLLRLRQACCHPHLIKDYADNDPGAAPINDDALQNAMQYLAADVVERLKILDDFGCPICYDVAGNIKILTPCGHLACPECFIKISEPAGAQRLDGDRPVLSCPQCRVEYDPKKVTDWAAFKKAYGLRDSEGDPAKDMFGAENHDESDSDDDSDDESNESDSDEDETGSLNGFIVKDEEEEEIEDDDEDSEKDFVPDTKEEFDRKLANAKDDDEEDEDELAAIRPAVPVRAMTTRSSSGERKSHNVVDGLAQAAAVDADDDAKEDTKKNKKRKSTIFKGKEKKREKPKKRKTLAVLQQEARRNMSARRQYMKRLAKNWVSSTKVDACLNILYQIRFSAPEEKTIVFSQFTTFLDLLEIALSKDKFVPARYDGSMTAAARVEAVERFTKTDDCKVMLVSLKAGNAGLNLTAANHIVLLDPFWNPYIEEQAIDRAHRIGQRRPVNIHRILIEETVEDRIVALQEKKRRLIEGALDENASKEVGRLNTQDLMFLFGLTR